MKSNRNKTYVIGEAHKVHWWQWVTIRAFMACRFLSLIVSRQHGKSWLGRTVLEDFVFRFTRRKNPHALVVMKTAAQAYDVYFSHIDRVLSVLPEGIYNKQGSLGNNMRITVKRIWLKDPDYITIEIGGIGNIDSFRGRTSDFLLFDEAAYADADAYFKVLKPTLDYTGGLALVTSTVKGRNWFFENHNTFKDMNKQGYSSVNAIDFDVYSAQLKSNEWIMTEEAIYRRTGRMQIWGQEYMNDPDADLSVAAAPFSKIVNKYIEKNKNKKSLIPAVPIRKVFVVMDMGKINNNPAWELFPKHGGGVHFIGYKDDDPSQYAVLDRLAKKYKGYKIVLIYPEDVNQPSVMEGVTRLDLLYKYIRDKGYQRIFEIRDLPKTKSRANFIIDGVELINKSSFHLNLCEEGMRKLAGVRMKEEKATGFISPKDFAKNGNQHCGDATCYVAAAMLLGFMSDYRAAPIGPEARQSVNGQRSMIDLKY